MKRTIILASSNKGKIKEIKEIFKDYEVLSLKEAEARLGKKLEVVENQPTFKENALEKTKTYSDGLMEVTDFGQNFIDICLS